MPNRIYGVGMAANLILYLKDYRLQTNVHHTECTQHRSLLQQEDESTNCVDQSRFKNHRVHKRNWSYG